MLMDSSSLKCTEVLPDCQLVLLAMAAFIWVSILRMVESVSCGGGRCVPLDVLIIGHRGTLDRPLVPLIKLVRREQSRAHV